MHKQIRQGENPMKLNHLAIMRLIQERNLVPVGNLKIKIASSFLIIRI